MRNIYTLKILIFICFSNLLLSNSSAQSLTRNPAVIINNIGAPARVFITSKGVAKTSVCATDTLNYLFNKATGFQALNMSSTGASVFAQWYPAPQAVSVYGFDFYAWQTAATSAVVSITCNIYNSTIDSLPSGLPVRSVTVSVDSTFGGGLLSVLRKKAIFSSPYTTSSPYVITIETSSSVTVAAVSNNWSATPPDGRSQWLSSIKLTGTYLRSYNINVSGSPLNSDFIMQPYVSYSMTAGFTTTNCNAGGNLVSFTNTSSPILQNPFYSVRAFQGIPQYSSLWDYGDTSGSWYAVNGSHVYSYRIPHLVKLQDTLYGWQTGCGDQTSVSLNAAPPSPGAHNNSPLCNSSTLRLSADTILGATYYWTGPNGFSSTLQNPSISSVNISMIGNYFVRAIIGQCSSMVASTYVNVISTPTASNNGPLCAGQTLNLLSTFISGASYSWTGPNSFSSSSQAPVKTGTTIADSGVYSVSITLAGCGTIGPFTTTAIINSVPTTPVVTNNGPLCVGDNLNLTSTSFPGGTYSWTGPNGFISTQQNPSRPSVINSFAGTYSVVISANGCSSLSGSTTVTINNVPSAPLAGNNGPLCTSQTLSLTASTISGATYSWSGPSSFSSTLQNPTLSSLTTANSGNYSVVATVNGCSSIASVTAVVITSTTPTPVANTNGPLCPGQSLQLSASTISGATYSWTGPNSFTSTQQNPTISSVTTANAGIYSVTAYTSGCGTSSSGNVTLVINSLPAAPTAGNNGPVCSGDSLFLTASSITGASYTWSGPNGFNSSQQNPVIANMNGTKNGVYSVYVTVSGCGTSSSSLTNAIVHAIPSTPNASSNAPVCAGDSIKFTATSFNVGPNATYSWTGPNSFNSSLKNPYLLNANSINTGLYYLTVSDSGCTSSSASTVVVVKSIPPSPTPSSNAPICEGTSLSLSSSYVPNATYSWKGPNGFSSFAQNPYIQSATAVGNTGTYYVSSIVNGCTSLPASLTIIVNPLPATPVASNNSPKCIGDNISLNASTVPGAAYSWSGPGGFSSSIQNPVISNITTSMSGVYSVIAVSSTCISNSSSTAVIVNNFPTAPTLSTSAVSGNACNGDSVQFFASYVSGAKYNWTGPAGFGDSSQNPIIHNVSAVNSGTYYAAITKGGCSSTQASIGLIVNPLPNTSQISGPNPVRNYSVQQYTVSGSPGSVYNWVPFGGTIVTPSTTNSVSIAWGGSSTTAYLTVVEQAVSGCYGSQRKLNVTINSTSGINDKIMQIGNVSVYPNPANKNLTIDFELIKNVSATIEFINMLGQTVMNATKDIAATEKMNIDISSLHNGIYFMKVSLGDEFEMIKLTVE